jgi:hypothetical protein
VLDVITDCLSNIRSAGQGLAIGQDKIIERNDHNSLSLQD